jgi:hypothetical protein
MRKCERIAHKMRVRCRSVRTDKDDLMDGSGEDEEDANEPKETLVGQPESIQGTLKSYQVYMGTSVHHIYLLFEMCIEREN